jgi:16S rRNA (uracil1498-N3)-methyltransferase
VHRFYAPGFLNQREVELPEDEAHHLSRVLRLTVGDTIAVFDGEGREAIARVASIGSRSTKVTVIEPRRPVPEPAVAVTLAQALLKSDKMDRVIRDAVMLGVSAIQPFVSKRTDVPPAALKRSARRGRWERTIISSVKQCGRAVVPSLLATADFPQLLTLNSNAVRLMLVEPGGAGSPAISDLKTFEDRRPAEAMVLIGPEGGWERHEIDKAQAAGVALVTLGSRVLRADAAGAAAIAVLRYIWQDL